MEGHSSTFSSLTLRFVHYSFEPLTYGSGFLSWLWQINHWPQLQLLVNFGFLRIGCFPFWPFRSVGHTSYLKTYYKLSECYKLSSIAISDMFLYHLLFKKFISTIVFYWIWNWVFISQKLIMKSKKEILKRFPQLCSIISNLCWISAIVSIIWSFLVWYKIVN